MAEERKGREIPDMVSTPLGSNGELSGINTGAVVTFVASFFLSRVDGRAGIVAHRLRSSLR